MMAEVREFVRDVGGPVAIAELFVLAVFLMGLLFGAGLIVGDL